MAGIFLPLHRRSHPSRMVSSHPQLWLCSSGVRLSTTISGLKLPRDSGTLKRSASLGTIHTLIVSECYFVILSLAQRSVYMAFSTWANVSVLPLHLGHVASMSGFPALLTTDFIGNRLSLARIVKR
jgi:hypothetical protein